MRRFVKNRFGIAKACARDAQATQLGNDSQSKTA
jgi:hypothetical protein